MNVVPCLGQPNWLFCWSTAFMAQSRAEGKVARASPVDGREWRGGIFSGWSLQADKLFHFFLCPFRTYGGVLVCNASQQWNPVARIWLDSLPPFQTAFADSEQVSAADVGLTGDIQFLQHVPFTSSIASPSAAISLNKTGRERARKKYSKKAACYACFQQQASGQAFAGPSRFWLCATSWPTCKVNGKQSETIYHLNLCVM